MLLALIIATVIAIAALGIHGGWVFLVGLALMAAHEKKNPGVDLAEAAAATLFLGVVAAFALSFILRLCCN